MRHITIRFWSQHGMTAYLEVYGERKDGSEGQRLYWEVFGLNPVEKLPWSFTDIVEFLRRRK